MTVHTQQSNGPTQSPPEIERELCKNRLIFFARQGNDGQRLVNVRTLVYKHLSDIPRLATAGAADKRVSHFTLFKCSRTEDGSAIYSLIVVVVVPLVSPTSADITTGMRDVRYSWSAGLNLLWTWYVHVRRLALTALLAHN